MAAEAALLLSACRANPFDRGTLHGAAAGGLTSHLTDAGLLDLGDLIWENADRPGNNATTIRIQAGLAKLGCTTGAVDSIKQKMPPPQAIGACQREHGIP